MRVIARPELDVADPGAASELLATEVSQRVGHAAVLRPRRRRRRSAPSPATRSATAPRPSPTPTSPPPRRIAAAIEPDEPGQLQSFEITGLLPETTYYVALRAFDDCKNYGPLIMTSFRTPERVTGEVDACFVATAAYGSFMANEVGMLRSFRDGILRQSVLGELFVETYYTVGPAFSANIDHSDVLRHAARDSLAPLVDLVRGLKVEE